MTEPSPLDLVDRNTLLKYARRRIEEGVIGPLKMDTADDATLLKAEKIIDGLRAHFRGLHIDIGPLRAENGEIIVDVKPMPR
jgi:hypothetical protein